MMSLTFGLFTQVSDSGPHGCLVIYGMVIDIGPKFYSATSPLLVMAHRSRSWT